VLDPLSELSDIPTPVWAAVSGAISCVVTWFLGLKKLGASLERARLKLAADASTNETAERAAFRTTLMTEITALRQLIRECDAERDILRGRVNATEGQILLLKASNEIMERWVGFFKDRNALDPRLLSGTGPADDTT
jgi:hypothetical protein